MAHARRGRDSRQGDKMKQGWMPVVVSLSLLLVVAASGCNGNSYEAGLDAFHEGDYTTALNTFRPLAERGEAQAQFKLGAMYHQGKGMEQDDEEAVCWRWRGASDVTTAKGLSIWGGDLPKAFQVSNLARKAHCINRLGSVVIMETGSGRLGGEMTTTPVEHPDIWGFLRERSDFVAL